jgi:hypothetical protein
MDKENLLKEINGKLEGSVDELNLENSDIINYAHSFYLNNNKSFKYYFVTLNPFKWLIGLVKITCTFIFLFVPSSISFEEWGLSKNLSYRSDLDINSLLEAYNIYAKFDLTKEVPLFLYITNNWTDINTSSFIITNKYFYFNLLPDKKFKITLKSNPEYKVGKIDLKKIEKVRTKGSGGDSAVELYVNDEQIGAFYCNSPRDHRLTRKFLNNIPKQA